MRQHMFLTEALLSLVVSFGGAYGKPGLFRREFDQPETLLEIRRDTPKVASDAPNATETARLTREDVGLIPKPEEARLQTMPGSEVTVLPAEPAPKSQRGLKGWKDVKTYHGVGGLNADPKPFSEKLASNTLESQGHPERVKESRIDHAKKMPAFPRKIQRKLRKVDSLLRLPFQPSCNVLVNVTQGLSDHGRGQHTCEACSYGCNSSNRQRPMNVRWDFLPPLAEKLASDMMMVIQFDSVDQVRPFSMNGVQHHTKFNVATQAGGNTDCGKCCSGFKGEMGPQAYGGSDEADAMNGQHVFTIMDSVLPAPDGSYVQGRWLALPGKKWAGHIGTCRRHCVNCEGKYPELLQEGQSTGTICTAPVSIRNRQTFVYRLYRKVGTAKIDYDAAPYVGAEWEVQIQDPTTGTSYPLGSIILEGTSNQSGIADVSAEHGPVGCAPCDAYYHAVQTTGPFILSPRGKHELEHAVEEPGPDPKGRGCFANRVIGLGGYTLLFESGPGVTSAPRQKDAFGKHTLFRCPVSKRPVKPAA